MALAGSRLAPEAAKLIREIVERRLKDREPNEDVIDSALKRLVPLLDEAEEALTHNQFWRLVIRIGGCVLDGVYQCVDGYAERESVRSRPQLSAWWDRRARAPIVANDEAALAQNAIYILSCECPWRGLAARLGPRGRGLIFAGASKNEIRCGPSLLGFLPGRRR